METQKLNKETSDKISFIAFIVPFFAETYKMNMQSAFFYLKKYGAWDYLNRHWWALHTDNAEYAAKDLYEYCYENGGLRWKFITEVYTVIHEIDLIKCVPKRDFGRGFYVTKLREQAEIFAVRKGNRKRTESIITEFEFDEDVYEDNDFQILVFSDYNSDWFDFVIKNRKSRKIAHDYDIVEGPVADDKIQTHIQSFLDDVITKEEFFNQLKHPEPSHQICFCTVNSLKALKKTDYKIIYKVDNINEPIIEQLVHDCLIDETKAADLFFSSAIFGQLANVETKFYLKDWQEIYKMLKKELNL